MNVLVVYCHPCSDSYTAAVRDTVVAALGEAGHASAVIDLYGERFDPVMSAEERRGYHDEATNLAPFEDHARHLRWAQMVIFIYPTWWYGLPAMLKGWLERVMVPGFAFKMPTRHRGSRPNLTNIRRLMVFTTCGATPLVSWVMGQPGRRTLLRGFRSVCHVRCRTGFMALYKMDSASDEARRRHLARIRSSVLGIKP
ncbi:Putative NADPH-quinone reductase (modulator of drug activity B) [Kaistia soli DSM 19436]|uniref:Putative NADPH-quinone reductase (Modulator of drug activity B) n=1 Tax=Kaistia soli DSM 19436 TaxID=1122133 RepID=A0A1M5PG64_9HYPH|nr:NAD(P)H-dependent oxidoreductase [Kaistia soli]SHH00804.1 Putative NADPH-quinone reductase (modulator of drug activity B) [Kaistia soli DSM 19436]